MFHGPREKSPERYKFRAPRNRVCIVELLAGKALGQGPSTVIGWPTCVGPDPPPPPPLGSATAIHGNSRELAMHRSGTAGLDGTW